MDEDDFIWGGAGDDIIINNFGSNFLLGDSVDGTILAVDGHSAADASVNEADFETVDTLEGGAGDDRLIGDDGDVMTGGTGADEFVVETDIVWDQAVAQITDFDIKEDVLTLYKNAQTSEGIIFKFD